MYVRLFFSSFFTFSFFSADIGSGSICMMTEVLGGENGKWNDRASENRNKGVVGSGTLPVRLR